MAVDEVAVIQRLPPSWLDKGGGGGNAEKYLLANLAWDSVSNDR